MPLAPSYDDLREEVSDLRRTVEYLERKRDQELRMLEHCNSDRFQLEDELEELRWHLECIVKGIQALEEDSSRAAHGGLAYVPLGRVMRLINTPPPPRPSPVPSTGSEREGQYARDLKTLLGRIWERQGRPRRER